MKVSIIVCAYKSEDVIRGMILHLLKMKYPKKEIIIAVDTQEDNTYKIVKEFKDKIKISYSEKRRGIIRAFNDALKKATGDIIVKFDAEYRFCVRNPIEKIVKHYENPNIMALTFCPEQDPNRYKKTGKLAVAQNVITMIVSDWRSEKYPTIKGFFPLPLFVHSFRNIIKKIDEDSINDDAELAYYILDKGYEVGFANDVKFYALKEPSNVRDIFHRQRRTTVGWLSTKRRRVISLRFYYLSLLKFYILHIRRYGPYSLVCLAYFGTVYSISIFGAYFKLNEKITKLWIRK